MLSGQHMALMKGVIILLMYWACGQMLASLSTQGSSRVLASATILTKGQISWSVMVSRSGRSYASHW